MQTRKNINKQFLCLFVPVAVVLGLIVGYFYFSEVEKERSGLEANEILHVNLGRQVIEKDLEAAVADLGVLSQHREFDRIDTPRNPEALEHLAQEFLVFVQNKRHYDQIRFLDEAGKEVIRINLGSGHPYIVPEDRLQDKSRRYYFTDAMRLKEGEILVSPLDLNIERGEVERPVKPTIRLVTTVLYGQGKKRGVIVLNYLGSSLMRVLKEVETGIEDHAMILNADGYWLGDPRAEHGLTFKNQFPEAWKRIAKADGGSFYNGKGLFAFATVYPQREVLKLTAGATVADEPIRSEVEGKDKEYHWKVVTHVSSQHIDAATAAVSMKLLLTSASLFGFLAASVWWLAQARVRRMESEERFSLAVRGSNDGIWDWDLKSALIFFSPRWKQMLDYELDDIDNNFMTWRDLVHPDDLGRFLVLWTDYMDGQSESFFIEYRIRRKAGDYAWVLCRGSSLRDEVGHIVRLSGSQTDITERHQADSKLRLQTSALTAADDGIVITDREGNIQWVNRAYTRLTGYGLDEVLGKNPRILKSGKHNQIFYKKMWDTILGGKTWHGELWNKRKDGSLYLEEESITPVLGQGGEVGHFIAIKRDITDRKSIEEELVRFKSTLDKTLDCVFMFEPESLKFFYVNQGAMEQVGYSHEDMMQMTPLDIKPKFDEAKFRKMIAPLIAGPVHTATFETIHQHKDGHHISVEISLQYVFPKGEPPRFVAFVRDITERQQLQKQLQQAQKMEAIGQLTGGIAHDFNNMLSGVLGFTELAREELAQYDNEKIEGYLSQVYNSGSRARDLVAQMLAFSRGGEGKLEPFMLSPLIKESLKMLGSTLPSSIEVDLQLEGDDLIVMTNPVQLHQLVMNLCINARDAMDGKGHITIGLQRVNSIVTECCSCHERVRGDYIELFFRDTGPGIQPEQMDRLFDPFYTTKDVGKGTGMGLSMVHGIMHDHGGHVLVESGPGKGTTFALLFPVIDVQVDTVNMEGNDANAKSEQVLDGNILIVDDEISVGGFIGEMLKGHGCQVTVETDSKLALSRFRGNPEAFDLVITDQTMPGMTGAELAQSLIAIRPELPVILCTGYSEHLDAVGAEAIGIRGYVNKPIEIDGFLGLVKELLQDREISV